MKDLQKRKKNSADLTAKVEGSLHGEDILREVAADVFEFVQDVEQTRGIRARYLPVVAVNA